MTVRVCILTSVHPPFDIRIFHKECKSLVRAGYDVTLIAPYETECTVDGIRILPVVKASGRVHRLTRTLRQIYHKALETSADVYHFHDPELIPVGLLLRARGKAVVYDIHEDVPRCIPYKPYLPKWTARFLPTVVETAENAACRCFSALVTATPGIAGRFCAVNRQIHIVNNYPLLRELALLPDVKWESRSNSVVYVGSSVSLSRGAREMVDAMGLLRADLEVSLEMVGPFQPSELKEQLCSSAGWCRVKSHGFLGRDAIARVLGHARAGLVVLHPEPNYVASKPIKMFEYMAAAVPVIASDFPLWRQIIDGAKCGICVDPLNPKLISEAIEYLIAHPAEAEAMGRRGQEAVLERYNWGSEEAKLLDLYRTMTVERSRAARSPVAVAKA